MTFQVRYTKHARADMRRLFAYLAQRDPALARKARETIGKGMDLLKEFPFTCRKASQDTPFLRELVIRFGSNGYIALFEIDDANTVTVLAVRHQRGDDYS